MGTAAEQTASTEETIREALRGVIDPEIGVNIVDIGLVYGIALTGGRAVVTMTMTSPACPLTSYMTAAVTDAVRNAVPDIDDVQVDLVWDPAWHPTMMSDRAKRDLGWLGN